MRTTVDLPEDLFRRAKAKAAIEGRSLRSVIVRFIEEGLAREAPAPGGGRRRSALPEFAPVGTEILARSSAELNKLLADEDLRRELRAWRG